MLTRLIRATVLAAAVAVALLAVMQLPALASGGPGGGGPFGGVQCGQSYSPSRPARPRGLTRMAGRQAARSPPPGAVPAGARAARAR